MPDQHVEQPSAAELRMVVRRADGTIHDHGIVSAHYRNPLKQAWWRLVGRPLANRRIRRSNRHVSEGG
jgi:hypothetical protein